MVSRNVTVDQFVSDSSTSLLKISFTKLTLKVNSPIIVYCLFYIFPLHFLYFTANGEPYIRKGDQSLTLPNQLDGLLFERVANFVIVQAEGLGFKLKWDTKVY